MTQASDPHEEGLDAFLIGIPETANPYDVNDAIDDGAAHMSWNDGWHAGADDADDAVENDQ